MCICASEKSQFRRRTNGARTRAGGVTPPWLRQRNRNGVRQHAGDSLPSNCGSACASTSASRTAGSRPPLLTLRATVACESVRNCPGMSDSRSPRRPRASRSWYVGVCTSQKSQFRRRASARTRAGGRKLPVVSLPPLQRRSSTPRSAVSRTFAEAPVQARLPKPRRAYTRRSWRCAGRACPNMHVIAPATRLPVTRRAHVRRSCVWRSFAGEKATFALHKRTLANKSGGA